MLKDLFINATILVASISFGNALLRHKVYSSSKPLVRILIGLLSGFLGCILMIFSVSVAPDIIIDFRNIPILIMVFYSSPISAITTALTIGLFRVLYFGLSESSATAFVIALAVGIGCILISKLKQRLVVRWTFAVVFTCAIVSAGLIALMAPSPSLLSVLVSYNLGLSIASFAVHHLLSFHSKTNMLFSKAMEESQKDFLTGLYNLRHGEKSLNAYIKMAREKQSEFSILLIDIDNFKNVNDYNGHLAGDKVLKNVAAILINECRSADIIYRRGGDEFSVILVDCNLAKAKIAAERIRKNINGFEHLFDSGESITITVSIGISSYPTNTDDEEKLIEQADKALYEAKRTGKNAISWV